MNATALTRLERVRVSAGIAQLALQQTEDEPAGLPDPVFRARVLRELFEEADPKGGLLGSLQQLLTVASQAAVLGRDDAEAAACALEEAAVFAASSPGMLLHQATSTLHPQGERP
ncbi:hypothetical protein [Streptomyces vietnamensis]|uniref:Uncharacterized protein n=1 Tax=Streptomyces vietnamensis TaxID=362257 RepID=A0A0B5IPU6_9ACTN|nr:hypothetical protein [Streptomyces vietnamensis]AJF70449.1 hypothetical protein SVTN_40510 [Streptomyces vietnamensis]